jgi:hypothetical protein
MSIQTPITVAEATRKITNRDYILPAIQREFVWDGEQIERLFDSLMRGYPIGSLLFWSIKPERLKDFQFYTFMEAYHERDRHHNEPIDLTGDTKTRIAVLDGQQRLTALYLGLKGTYADKIPYYRWSSEYAFPKRRLYINLLAEPDYEADMAFKFKFLKEQDVVQSDDVFWFPVGDILKFKELADVFGLCVEKNLLSKELKHPSKILSLLWQVICEKPTLIFFLEEDDDPEKALNIFIRINSGGTTLSYSDMLMSIAIALWKELDAKKEINALQDNLNKMGESFNFSKDFILKAALVLGEIKTIAFKVNSFNRENMISIEKQWKHIRGALATTVRLVSSWGYNRDTLISANAIIPLAYFIKKQGNPDNFVLSPQYKDHRDSMHRWLIGALLKQTFSGQSDQVLSEVRTVLANTDGTFPEQAIYEQLKGSSKSMSFDADQIDNMLDFRYGKPGTFTVLSLLYPWLKYDQHFHIDHIFPRSMFTEKRLSEKGITEDGWSHWLDHKDDLGNLQLLQGLVNQNKSDKDFEAWLNETHPEPANLQVYKKEHFIPDVDLAFEKFPAFLEARTQVIKDQLEQLLGVS